MVIYFERDTLEIGIEQALLMLLYIVILLFGLQRLVSLQRFLNYLNFQLLIEKDQAILKKRINVKLEKISKSVKDLNLIDHGSVTSIQLGDIEILSCNSDNLLLKETIEALYKKLISQR